MSARRLASGSDALARLLAKVLAPYLQEYLRSRADSAPPYYHQADSPLGKRRHLELVRRGVLAGHKAGRLVLVRRDDVHAYIEARNATRRASVSVADDPLEDWGLERGERH